MAITVGNKEVYKIIQNGKLQRVVNKGDKQLFRGDQLKSSYVSKYKSYDLVNESMLSCAILDNDIVVLQTEPYSPEKLNTLTLFKKENDNFELAEKIENIPVPYFDIVSEPLIRTTVTFEKNIAIYGINEYIYLFNENGKFILKKPVLDVFASHNDKYFFFQSGNGSKPLKALDLNYDVIGTYENVVGMAIFDNGNQIRLKENGVYLFENNKETLILNFEEENIKINIDSFRTSYHNNKNYFAFVTTYYGYRGNGHVVFLFNKNGKLIYRTLIPYGSNSESEGNKTTLFLDEYNAVYVTPKNNGDMCFSKIDLNGNIVDMPGFTKRGGVCSYVNKKQELARKTNEKSGNAYLTFYKNRHLK